jgi:transposase-like protein
MSRPTKRKAKARTHAASKSTTPEPRALRAAKLSRVPGVTIGEAAKRMGVTLSQVRRARQDDSADTRLSLEELVLAALTREGRQRSGKLDSLSALADWVDYVNHDGCQPDEVRRMLRSLAKQGVLSLEGDRWKLLKPWP